MINRKQIKDLLRRADRHLDSGNTAEAWRCYVDMMRALQDILNAGIQSTLEEVVN